MIRIIDATLCHIDHNSATPEQLRILVDYLIEIGSDFIELTISVYQKIGELNPNGSYILRVNSPEESDEFPQFDMFVCRRNGYPVKPSMILEIQANDVREIHQLNQYSFLKNVRIVGFDDIFNHDYIASFQHLKNIFRGKISFCPEDKYCCATAIAIEWGLYCGGDVVTTFAGIGGKAATEEVMMCLRLEKKRKPNLAYSVYPKLRALFEEITTQTVPDTKPIIGKNIFNVESGIHINGILINPKYYEPFEPELVGNARRFVIGKHSGKGAVIMKLKEFDLYSDKIDIEKLTGIIKNKSVENKAGVSDAEIRKLVDHFLKNEVKPI